MFDRREPVVYNHMTGSRLRTTFTGFLRKLWKRAFYCASRINPQNLFPSGINTDEEIATLYRETGSSLFPNLLIQHVFRGLKVIVSPDGAATEEDILQLPTVDGNARLYLIDSWF